MYGFFRLLRKAPAGAKSFGCFIFKISPEKTPIKITDNFNEAECLKPSKCNFIQNQVQYLKCVVSEQGILVDPAKVEAVKRYRVLSDLKSLCFFL